MRRDLILFLLCIGLVMANVVLLTRETRSNAALRHELRRVLAAVEQRNCPETGRGISITGQDSEVLRAEARRAFSSVCADAEKSHARAPADAGGPMTQDHAALHLQDGAPRPEALKASEEGNKLVDQALVRRKWTAEDALNLRQWLHQMAPPARRDIISRLIRSTNEGKIQLTDPRGHFF
jgi:hypothetical protein